MEYWAIDQDGYEYLTEDVNDPNLARPVDRKIDKENCPRLYNQMQDSVAVFHKATFGMFR